MAPPSILTLKIANAQRTFYNGPALSLSSQNDTGPFDILPDHAHFVSLLNNATVTVLNDQGQTQQFLVHRGLISVRDNSVQVFVDL
jgi:F0F1-type ATP synthase epsilon subunit